MARIYPYDVSADALFSPAKGLDATDYFQQWDRDDMAEPHLLCAEMSRLAYAKQDVVEKALPRVGFALKRWLGGERLTERFAAWGADGFVATGGDGRIVVAFRHHPPTLHWDALLSALHDLAKVVGGGQSVREGLHSVGARLLPGGMGATVPLRDLADHAPINYVSAMVRSFRPPG